MQNKFNSLTNDFLIGIRFNNYKDWFHTHKDMYKKNVHEPMVELANEVYERMHQMDSNFVQTPKISRANRDIRFSKNKNPYKESKWFFLRADGKPDLTYPKPTYFFEISPDWWRYGLFYAPKPSNMAAYRVKPVSYTHLDVYKRQQIYYIYSSYADSCRQYGQYAYPYGKSAKPVSCGFLQSQYSGIF